MNSDDIKGKAKEAAGDLTGNDDLKNEGKVDQVVGDIKEKAEDAVEGIKDAAEGVADKVKGLLNRD